tara:strand:- start:6635 stop:6976 length:342 start_codon:yes stop_codon:yes gene_type:complete
MDKVLLFFKECNFIDITSIDQLTNVEFERNFILSLNYETMKANIPMLKQTFSSSELTSLQNNAEIKQKWPQLNIIRQLLSSINLKLKPIRKANGYDKYGKKLYRRLFIITKMV